MKKNTKYSKTSNAATKLKSSSDTKLRASSSENKPRASSSESKSRSSSVSSDGNKSRASSVEANKLQSAIKSQPLTKVSEMPKTYSPRVFSQREQDEKLTGYLEISVDIWPQIRYGTHIRYYLKTGEFRTGGFVSKNPFDVFINNDSIQNPNQPERLNKEKKTYIKIQNGFNEKLKGYYQWIVAYDDIEKIYIKPDAGVLTMVKTLESVVGGLNDNIQKLAQSARLLEKRIAQLER